MLCKSKPGKQAVTRGILQQTFRKLNWLELIIQKSKTIKLIKLKKSNDKFMTNSLKTKDQILYA